MSEIEYAQYIGRDTFFQGRVFRLLTERKYRDRVCMDMMFGTVNEMTRCAVPPSPDGERGTALHERNIPWEEVWTWVVKPYEINKTTVEAYLAQDHLSVEDLALTGLDGPRGLIA